MGELVGAYRPLELDTTAGALAARLYPVDGARAGIVLLDGSSPELWQSQGVCAIVPTFKDPADAPGCVLEGLLCAYLLREQGLVQVLAAGPGAEELARVLPGVEVA
ncbi:MAG: hypothetical protein JWM80_6235 [Cyanobacteria bacterium RYN_339]|nr:hypothetical protein [Cyanobacteria bacterium RYN_339]